MSILAPDSGTRRYGAFVLAALSGLLLGSQLRAAEIPAIGNFDVNWSYPVVIEIWVETESQSYWDAQFYDWANQNRNLKRSPGATYDVPYRVGRFIIDQPHAVDAELDPLFPEAVVYLTFVRRMNDDGFAFMDWHHYDDIPLPRRDIERSDPLFPLAVLISLVQHGYGAYIGDVKGEDIYNALWANPIRE
jgi:hypothetical protein